MLIVLADVFINKDCQMSNILCTMVSFWLAVAWRSFVGPLLSKFISQSSIQEDQVEQYVLFFVVESVKSWKEWNKNKHLKIKVDMFMTKLNSCVPEQSQI